MKWNNVFQLPFRLYNTTQSTILSTIFLSYSINNSITHLSLQEIFSFALLSAYKTLKFTEKHC